VWWKCAHGHEWLAAVSHRKRGNGCPYCSNKKILKGYNDLATIHPEIAAEWDYEKNGELTPFEIAPASNKKAWWKCKLGHGWQATILNRHQGNNCPICSNQQILVGYNDLATTHPELIDEWHTEKNGNMHPTNVVAGSSRRVWWIGRCGHEWQTPINSRTNGTGCPYCARGTRISFPEKTLLTACTTTSWSTPSSIVLALQSISLFFLWSRDTHLHTILFFPRTFQCVR
jgi:DNA-directed RNA polymerase subunit RPC12/RpoP